MHIIKPQHSFPLAFCCFWKHLCDLDMPGAFRRCQARSFKKLRYEPCLFVNAESVKVLLWVDDVLVRGSKEASDRFHDALEARFECRDGARQYGTIEAPKVAHSEYENQFKQDACQSTPSSALRKGSPEVQDMEGQAPVVSISLGIDQKLKMPIYPV